MRLSLPVFVIATLIVEIIVARIASSSIDGGNGFAVTSFFLCAAAYSYARAEAALRWCKIDDANISFCVIMLITAICCLFITLLTATVSICISYKPSLDVILQLGIFDFYSFVHEQHPQLMLLLTIMEIVACLMGGRSDVGRAIFNRINPVFRISREAFNAAYSERERGY